jgi:hypothetical protein
MPTAWLTGTHAKMTAGADLHAGTSADQIAAAHFGKVPCRAGVGTASIPFLQLNNAQMILHMCHGSPSAIHGTPIYMLRSILGIPDESNHSESV